jgi:hypothetical protein
MGHVERRDLAGNPLVSATIAESGAADLDF